jgi:hypothetical protein
MPVKEEEKEFEKYKKRNNSIYPTPELKRKRKRKRQKRKLGEKYKSSSFPHLVLPSYLHPWLMQNQQAVVL